MNIVAFISWLIAPLIWGVDDALIAAAIAAAVAGTATAAAGVANSISAKKQRKAAEKTIGGLNAENSSNYYADYYRGALQNDTTRAYLKRLDSKMAKNNQALDNTIVSSGATHENALAQRQGRNAVMSDTMANIVAAEDARRDRVRNNYFARKSQLEQADMNSRQAYSAQKQANRAQIASGIGQIASSFASLYGGGSGGSIASGAASSGSGYFNPRADMNKGLYGVSNSNLAGTVYARNGGKVPPITMR